MLLCMSCFSMIFVPLFNLFVSRLRYSLMNEREVHVIVLHSLCSTLPTASFKQLTRNTSHDLAVSSSSLNLQAMKVPTAHMRTSWLISSTAAQRNRTIYRSTYKRYRHVISHT